MEEKRENLQETEIDLRVVLEILRKNILPILIVTAVFAAGFYAYSALFITKQYQASATLIVNNKTEGSTTINTSEMNAAQGLAEVYSIIIKSEVITRFAELAVIPETHAMRHINVASVLVWTYVIYVVAFAALAVSYYFYAKRRFRNDEFRRVNTKRFVINALKNFLGFGLILSSILFIIARWGLMPTSVVVFNPMDAFVIVFTILGLIFFGFTIKNLVVSFKNARKRKEAIKLKLDQDVADDGTN